MGFQTIGGRGTPASVEDGAEGERENTEPELDDSDDGVGAEASGGLPDEEHAASIREVASTVFTNVPRLMRGRG